MTRSRQKELSVVAFIRWPRTAFYAAVLGMALMAGAIVTHLRVPEVGFIPLASVVFLLCLFVAWQRGPEPIRRALRRRPGTAAENVT